MRRALRFPVKTVAHLDSEAQAEELRALAALESQGAGIGLLALPAAVEDSFYRYNNLPGRLAALYRDLDPLDPDEDLLEEAEPLALQMLAEAFLLDEVIDAIYQSLELLPAELHLRRAGESPGAVTSGRRSALLAIRRLFRHDWRAEAVAGRLTTTFSIALEARPLLIHAAVAGPAADVLHEAAQAVLGRPAVVLLDAAGEVVRVE